MFFTVPAGNTLRFESEDGTPLDQPTATPAARIVEIGRDRLANDRISA